MPKFLLISDLLLALLFLHLPEPLSVPLVSKPLKAVLLDLLQRLQPPLLVALDHAHLHRTARQLVVAYEHVHEVLSFEVGYEVHLELGMVVGVNVHKGDLELACIVK